MSLPLEIWVPAGAVLISGTALGALLFIAWGWAPDGEKWHGGIVPYTTWALLALGLSIAGLILGVWWWARPW